MLHGRQEGRSGQWVRIPPPPISRRNWTRARAVSSAGSQAPTLKACPAQKAPQLPVSASFWGPKSGLRQGQAVPKHPALTSLSLSPGSSPGFPSQDHGVRNLLPSGFPSGSLPALLRQAEESGEHDTSIGPWRKAAFPYLIRFS